MRFLQRKSARSIATVFIALAAMVGSSSQAEAGLLGPSSDYIVQITPAARAAVESAVKNAGGTVGTRYQYAFDGFVVKLPDMLLPILKKIPNILTIEKDAPVAGLAIQQNEFPTPSWGLDRVDQREIVSTATGYQGNYGYRSAGTGATIYIGDTGIYPHEDLAGRISTSGFSGISDGNGTVDCNGHGTHVATTAAGTKYGIAKNAKVVPVRILNCAGSGSYATVIAGLDWIMSPLNTNSKTQAVLNLSIGGGASSSINDAILRLTNAGITVVAAAGNETTDACTRSPASAPTAITVGATTIVDTKAGYSNYGPCVDIFAPGSGITGGWYGSATATNTISGTSMATPHVTGAAAVFLGLNPTASVAQVADALKSQSTKGAVQGLDATTVNNLLYISPTDGGPAIVAPAVQITTVSEITHLQAKANVEINPNNAPTNATIEYATDNAFTSIVKRINLTPTALDGGLVISLPVIFDGLNPSSTYYFRATAENESGSYTTPVGSFKSLAPPVTPPTPKVLEPSSITGWSARLNGTVNANNGTTTVSFVYGTDPDFLTNTQTGLASPQTVGGSTATSVALDISYLDGATKYYVKLVASNSAASVQSDVISFTTPAVVGVAPLVETIRPAGGLNTPTTTITGRVNPMGQTTSVRLVYATDQGLSISPKIVNLPSTYTGIDTVTVTADMTGLTPGVRYYYRFEAANAAGLTKPVALTNTGNPVMPVVVNNYVSAQTQTGLTLNTNVNAGASNTRIYFVYGTDPLLETGTVTVQGTPFAIAVAGNYLVQYPLAGLKPNTTIYYRTKILAYTGPLLDKGGILLGPIASGQTLMPVRATQTISFTLPASRTFIGSPTPLTATASSGLPVTYSTTTPTICQILATESGTVLTAATPIPAVAGAACVITASQTGNDQFNPAVAVGRTINFVKESQSINFTNPVSKEMNQLNLLSITSTSGLPVTVTSTTPATCSVVATANGGYAAQVDPSVKGDTSVCAIRAEQAGNDRFAQAVVQNRSFTWVRSYVSLKATLPTSVTAEGSSISAVVIDRSNLPVGETLTGTSPLTFTSLTKSICTVETPTYLGTPTVHSSATVKAMWNGTCQITISFAGNDFLKPYSSTFVLSIAGITTPQPGANAAQTISFTQPLNYSVGSQVPLTVTAQSGLPVTVTSLTPAICAVNLNSSGKWIATSASGLSGDNNYCQLKADQAGDDRWAAAASVTRTFRYTRLSQAITFTAPSTRFYGGPATKLVATASSGLPVTFTTTTPNVCQIQTVDSASVMVPMIPAGALNNAYCYITASQAGDGTYLPAPVWTRSVLIQKESTTIKGVWAGPITTTGTAFNLTVSSASQPTLGENIAGTTVLGVVTRTPSICQVDKVEYAGTSTAHSVATVKAMWNGTCQLAITYSGNSYWLPSSVILAVTVSGLTSPQPGANIAQSVSLTTPATLEIGAITSIFPSATSKLPVSVTSLTPTICVATAVGTTYTIKSASGVIGNGNICTIQATQAGNDGWLAATPVNRTITINKAATVVRLSRTSTSITPTYSPLMVAGLAYISSPLNNGLNSIGNFLGVSTSTPAICSVAPAMAYPTTMGTYTQTTLKSLANGTCTITWSFAETDTQKAATLTQNLAVTGVK